jgi:hypothetical protein
LSIPNCQKEIEKNNFQVWKFKMMNFLMGKEYFEFIIGEKQKPTLKKNSYFSTPM